jgi:hypothetical protein
MTVPPEPRYRTPEAARTAVTDRLRSDAARGVWRLADLQRQYAYDQLVERLYRLDDGWVIKGATALLARRISVRHTLDIDLFRSGGIADVEDRLRATAGLEIGDWMRFALGPALPIFAASMQGVRFKARSFIGAPLWAAFQIDVVAGDAVMVGSPDPVPPMTDVGMERRRRVTWQAYPLVDHVADKVCVILEQHDGRPSTRFKDLIDLLAISGRATVGAALQERALVRGADRRGLLLPTSFDVPDRRLWERGYRAEARRTVGLDIVDLEQALVVVRRFVDPVLAGSARGSWDADRQTWR